MRVARERVGLTGKDFSKIIATIHTNVATPIQHASVVAYKPNAEIDEYFNVTKEIHRIMCRYLAKQFNRIDGINVTIQNGGFYFFADFNQVTNILKSKGVETSNDLGHSMLDHPHHIAAVTGDAIMLLEDNFGARVACVDYEGKYAFEDYKISPPKNAPEEKAFVEKCAPKMIVGLKKMQAYMEDLK